ncbi:MAG: thermonuclease family protein [Pyrinomonadaceae bacterium]|nr:thermonuclease family protein [Pyrinomonadaceae bacterium]
MLLCISLLLTVSVFSQRRLGGKVVEIVDAKTVIVETTSGAKMGVILQYIEVPEPGQQMHEISKEHLRSLVFGKEITVSLRGLVSTNTVGQLLLNGIDMSQQMIRDGAAWHAVMDNAGQYPAESANYQKQQNLAKSEKRGIWAVEGILTPWEFRAKRLEAAKIAEREEFERIKNEAIAERFKNELAAADSAKPKRRLAESDMILWEHPNAGDMFELVNEKGLISSKIPGVPNEVMMTGSSFFIVEKGKEKFTLESRIMYLGKLSDKDLLSIGFLSRSEKGRFKGVNELTISADGKTYKLGKGGRTERKTGRLVEEMMIYQIDRVTLTSIAQAEDVSISIGGYSSKMPVRSHELLKNLTLEIAKK